MPSRAAAAIFVVVAFATTERGIAFEFGGFSLKVGQFTGTLLGICGMLSYLGSCFLKIEFSSTRLLIIFITHFFFKKAPLLYSRYEKN